MHSFPDWFRMHVTKWHGFREVGNAVPPRLAKAVAGEIMKAMGVIPEKSEETLQLGENRLLTLSVGQSIMEEQNGR